MRMKSIAAGLAVAGALVLGVGATPAAAVSVGGGDWDYGTCQGGTCGTGGIVYSYYQHYSRTHKATACNNVQCYGGIWTAPSYLASGVGPLTLWGNTAYWATY